MAGEKRYLGIGEEATFGTAVAAAAFLDILRGELDVPSAPVLRYEGAGGRSSALVVPGPYVPQGDIEVGVDALKFPWLLRWGLGSWVATGTAVGGGSVTTLAAAAAAGDDTIEVAAEAGFQVGDIIEIGGTECVKISAIDGGGGPTYIWTLTEALQKAHGNTEDVTEVEAPFTHAFSVTQDRTLPSFTARLGKQVFEHVFDGATIGSMTFSVERGFLVCRLSLVARKDAKAVLDSSAKSFPTNLFSFRGASATIDAGDIVSKVESFEMEVTNNLDSEAGVRHGSRFAREFPIGEFTVNGKLQMVFTTQDEYDRFWGQADSPADVDLTTYNLEVNYFYGTIPNTAEEYRIKFILPKAYHTQVGAPVNGRDRITQEISFEGQFNDDVAWRTPVSIQVLNEKYRYP
ncbi:MAG: hypothetical protein HY678_12640 [Chloroflexi bacterium]|nr:hypothetical protein [Chloroflexota bacterium]